MSTPAFKHSSPSLHVCPTCKERSLIAYARISDVHASNPAYHQFGRKLLIAAYKNDELSRMSNLLDYFNVLDWARKTPRLIVGYAHSRKKHPLRRYLNDMDPSPTGRSRWDIYPSACDALKRFSHLPHTSGVAIFEYFHIEAASVTYTLYCPLPSWTRGIMIRLEALSSGLPITREHFLILLSTQD